MSDKKRILFVDDEAMLLEGLERMLYSMRKEWNMHFALGGEAALKLMDEMAFDVVLSDLRMPDMRGDEFLSEVMRLYPETARFILSGFADKDMVYSSVGSMHQFLSKPCDPEVVIGAIQRVLNLENRVANVSMKEFAANIGGFPSLPTYYIDLLNLLRSPDTTVEEIAEIVAKDPGMTAKMLQMVNSGFFGLSQTLNSPDEAVFHLGVDNVKSLVLGVGVLTQFTGTGSKHFSIDKLWMHLMKVSEGARCIARLEQLDKGLIEASATAGMLHDVGKLVLAQNMPEEYDEAFEEARSRKLPAWEAEFSRFGVSHADVGGYLLGLWGLPPDLVEATLLHHTPMLSNSRGLTPLTCVHVANGIIREHEAMMEALPKGTRVDVDYLRELGLEMRLDDWRGAVLKKEKRNLE